MKMILKNPNYQKWEAGIRVTFLKKVGSSMC